MIAGATGKAAKIDKAHGVAQVFRSTQHPDRPLSLFLMARKGPTHSPPFGHRPDANGLQQAIELHRQKRMREALGAYASALARDPKNHRGHFLHGVALMQTRQFQAAAASFGRAIALNAKHAEYFGELGVAHLALGDMRHAAEALREAIRRNRRDAIAHINLGHALLGLGDNAGALDALREAVTLAPQRLDALFNLANAQRVSLDVAGAEATYRQVLDRDPKYLPASVNLGGLLLEQKRFAEARDVFAPAMEHAPDRPELLYGHALACQELGDKGTAIAGYRRLVAGNLGRPDPLNNLAGLLEEKGENEEAIRLYERALAIDRRQATPLVNLGALYIRHDRHDEGRKLVIAGSELAPGDLNLQRHAATALRELRDWSAAETCLRRALAIEPEDLEIHHWIGLALIEQQQYAAALEHLHFVYESGEKSAGILAQLAEATYLLGDHAAGLDQIRQAIESDPDDLTIRSTLLMMLNYDDTLDGDEIAAEHRRQVADWCALQPPARILPLRPARERIRIGYVSPDFRLHSCAFFFEALLEGHDRSRAEIFCYANHPDADAITKRLRQKADHWREIALLEDDAVLETIDRDEIDVLVDLAGHTSHNRLGLFARRAAPLQANWLGYPNTTGLETMDLRITDEIVDPPGRDDERHTERLVRIAGGFLAYRAPAGLPDASETAGAGDGPIRFGCFNNAAKLSDATLALWAELLRTVPDSLLILRALQLVDDGARSRLRNRLRDHGVPDERALFSDYARTHREGIAGYREIDIALDPFPYNGTTTTCEALWMGVPVVALAGDRHAARVGASILTHVGLPELVARDASDYLRIAASLADDRLRLRDLRHELRPRFAASPLADGSRLARQFEETFGQAVQAAIAAQAE